MSSYPFTDAPFGATSPILRCSQQHGVDFGDALYIGDFLLRRAPMPEIVAQTYRAPHFSGFLDDMKRIAEYWYPIFHSVGH